MADPHLAHTEPGFVANAADVVDLKEAAASSTLSELLAGTVARWGDCPFLVNDGEGMIRYGEFQRRVHGLAAALAERGIGAGDRVVVVLPNCPEILYVWLALAHLGAILAPVNPALADAEIAAILGHLAPRAVIGDSERLAPHCRGVEPGLRLDAHRGADLAPLWRPRPAPPPPVVNAVNLTAPVTLLLTSGTTDLPKAVALPASSYLLPAREFVSWMRVGPADRFFDCLPLFHLAGQSFAVAAMTAGASLVVAPRFSARGFWDDVRRHRTTLLRHLGEMLAVLCRQPAHPAGDRHHTLRAVYGGGARPEVADEFERRFGVVVIEGYGLTETNTVLRNELRARRRGSIGRPLPYCEVRVADEEGTPLPASAAEPAVGEIQVRRNPAMMKEYVGAPELTAEAFAGGWFRTGDLGWRDTEGWFYFVGRSKDLIRRRGESLVPARIEKVLEGHPAVAHSAVVGVPDGMGGEEAKAFVVLRPDCRASTEELVDWCRLSLAEFEVPRFFELCADLPRTDTNKIHRSWLRALGRGSCYDRAEARTLTPMNSAMTAPGPGRQGTLAARGARLAALAEAVAARRDELGAGLVAHTRRVRHLAASEIDLALARLRAFGEVEPRLAGRAPLGTVAIMLPGNVALANPVATIGTAFLAGNLVVARFPASLRRWAEQLEPLFTHHLPGVRFDHGSGPDFMRSMLADPAVGTLMVFGDDRWAAHYESAIRDSRKKLIFEGPGKDPFLVLPGADLERAARDAVRGAYYHSGQSCTSPERFYVHAGLVEEFTDRVIELTRREVVGDPADGASTVGPIVSRKVVDRIAAQLADARDKGARVAAGGTLIDCVLADGTPATCVQPTVVTGVSAAMSIMRDETFGPIIPIQAVASAPQATELAGASPYGLAASVYGGDPGCGEVLAECHGQVFRDEIWLDYFGRNLHPPYGGRKRSGWVWEWDQDRFVRRDGARINAIELSRAVL